MNIPPRSQAGFTLIELMITAIIVALLAGIALPSYNEHVRKTRRTEARTALHEIAHHMERHYSVNGTYIGAQLPFNRVPRDAASAPLYALSFEGDVQDRAWAARATPLGVMQGDPCGDYLINHTGRRAHGANWNSPSDPACWPD